MTLHALNAYWLTAAGTVQRTAGIPTLQATKGFPVLCCPVFCWTSVQPASASCPAVVTVVHVGVVIFIIIAGLTQSKASNFIAGGCGASRLDAVKSIDNPYQSPCLQFPGCRCMNKGARRGCRHVAAVKTEIWGPFGGPHVPMQPYQPLD